MKRSIALLFAMMTAISAHASNQFECSANGIKGTITISTVNQGNVLININGRKIAASNRDRNALNMGMVDYTGPDVAVTLTSRGKRWDGEIVLDGKTHSMSCDIR